MTGVRDRTGAMVMFGRDLCTWSPRATPLARELPGGFSPSIARTVCRVEPRLVDPVRTVASRLTGTVRKIVGSHGLVEVLVNEATTIDPSPTAEATRFTEPRAHVAGGEHASRARLEQEWACGSEPSRWARDATRIGPGRARSRARRRRPRRPASRLRGSAPMNTNSARPSSH